jgi:DNA-binding CsgD family transcriptional regulator/PAS domain-containing protein
MDQLLFVTAVEAIYSAAPDPSRWPAALQAIADCSGDVGAILIWRRDDGAFGTIVSDTLIEAQRDYELSGWSVRELRALRTAERGYFFSGDAFTDRHVCSELETRTDPVYTQFLAQHGLGWFGAIAVSPDPHVGVALSVQRNAKTKHPFSIDELKILDRIGRHAEKSLRLSIRLFDAELIKVGLDDALCRVGIGVFVLDSLGRVIFANPVGKQLLGDGLTIIDEHLRVSAGAESAAMDDAVASVVRSTRDELVVDPKPILIRRSQSERPLAIYLLPVSASPGPHDQLLTGARAIVLVIDSTTNEPADPTVVRDLLGLTLGEARVAALVGSGLPPREAAEKLGITEETARTALKRVFSKTGISRQSELVALLSKFILR